MTLGRRRNLLIGLGVVLGSQLAALLPEPGPALVLRSLPPGSVWPLAAHPN